MTAILENYKAGTLYLSVKYEATSLVAINSRAGRKLYFSIIDLRGVDYFTRRVMISIQVLRDTRFFADMITVSIISLQLEKKFYCEITHLILFFITTK